MVRIGARQSLRLVKTLALVAGVVCLMALAARPQPASGASVSRRIDGWNSRRDRASRLARRHLPGHGQRPSDHDRGLRILDDRRSGYDQDALPQRRGGDLVHIDAAPATRRPGQGQARRQAVEVAAEPARREPGHARDARRDDRRLPRLCAGPAVDRRAVCEPVRRDLHERSAAARARRAPAVHTRHELELLA